MISSRTKIFVDENEFDFEPCTAKDQSFKLDSTTSVTRLKKHFYETLAGIGDIVKYNRADVVTGSKLAKSLTSNDAIVASFHEQPPGVPCRLLQHTKGGLMLPGGFKGDWLFRESTVLLVTTRHQANRLKANFRSWPFKIEPFYPHLDSQFLESPDTNTHDGGKNGRWIDLLYAGRYIAQKGICQTALTLNRWDCGTRNLVISGDFEPTFAVGQSGGNHANYQAFHRREVMNRFKTLNVKSEKSMTPECLAVLYRQSKIFAYASFHEDENYGLAPREAALCGAIPIVTDFCGLGEFGRKACCGIIRCWPSLGGVRFSLREYAKEMKRLLSFDTKKTDLAMQQNKAFVREECNGKNSFEQMQMALDVLLQMPVSKLPAGGWRCQERIVKMATSGPTSFRQALAMRADSIPEGLYPEGIGYEESEYSEAHFLTAIQGLYTTWPRPPQLRQNVRLHGFWRISAWAQERALVEFGFPGPRFLRFSDTEWRVVSKAAKSIAYGDLYFEINDSNAVKVFQRAIDLGFLVPDDPMQCELSEPNDSWP